LGFLTPQILELRIARWIKFALFGAILTPPIWTSATRLANKQPTEVASSLDSPLALPENKEDKVFSCAWDDSAFIFYQRPTYRIIDLNDPGYLMRANPLLHSLRIAFYERRVADIQTLVVDYFQSKYVYCRTAFAPLFDSDPTFRLLHRSDDQKFSL